MKTKILILLTAAMLTGCGWFDRKIAALTGDASKVCIDGVLYMQLTSGTTVAYTPDGKVKTCTR